MRLPTSLASLLCLFAFACGWSIGASSFAHAYVFGGLAYATVFVSFISTTIWSEQS